MNKCDNYAFNISRLLDACPFIDDRELRAGLENFLYEHDVDLNCINIDDLVVNGITFVDRDEYDEFSDEKKEDLMIVAENEIGLWILEWKSILLNMVCK